jgi:hypothetical protein
VAAAGGAVGTDAAEDGVGDSGGRLVGDFLRTFGGLYLVVLGFPAVGFTRARWTARAPRKWWVRIAELGL